MEMAYGLISLNLSKGNFFHACFSPGILSKLFTRFLPKHTLFGGDNIETNPNFDFDISLVPFLISCNPLSLPPPPPRSRAHLFLNQSSYSSGLGPYYGKHPIKEIWFLFLSPHSIIPLASSSCYLKFTAGVRGVREHISYLPLSAHMQQKVESGMHSISFSIKANFHFTI